MARFDVQEIMRLVGKKIIEVTDDMTNNIASNVINGNPGVFGTPVDTGHARHNWVLSFGAPDLNERPGVDISGDYAVGAVRSKLLARQGRNPFTLVWLTNNVPYIIRLNEAWSNQAPAEYVEAAIFAGQVTTRANFRVVVI